MSRCNLPFASWGWPEFAAALCAFARGKVRCGTDIGELERQLGRLLGESNLFALDSGRTALSIGLEGLAKLRSGRLDVIIPAYICPAVVNAIESAGLRPVFGEVGSDLNLSLDSARKLIGSNTLAILVAHMYGCPADIAEFEKLTNEADIFLIDDAAQVVGESVNERQLGTFGDFGLLSFAQSKSMVTGESGAGGILICSNPGLLPIVLERIKSLEPAQSRGKALVAFVWNYLLAPYTSRATYYWQRRIRPSPRSITPARIANLDAGIALCQLESLVFRRNERVQILDSYAKHLSAIDQDIQFPQYAPDRYLARAMVLLPSGSDVEACRQLLRTRSIETRRSYPAFSEDNDPPACASDLAGRLLEVPACSTMSDADVIRVCRCLKNILQGDKFL